MNEFKMSTSQSTDLTDFLIKHSIKNSEKKDKDIDSSINSTHTRIGSKELNIYGGSYLIPKEDLQDFYRLYYDHIFVNKKKEYLTEKQLSKEGPILVDVDLRYNYDVDTRKHSRENILDMILLYLEELKECYLFQENKSFDIFIFEKPDVNRLSDKSLTKDGIHMMICIQVDHTMQTIIRDKIVNKIKDVWDLPIINTWDSVFDEGISKGITNWQLFGSRKPGNDAYELTNYFSISYDKNDGEFMMDEMKVEDFDIKKNFYKLSAQNSNIPVFEMNPKIIDIYNKRLEQNNTKFKKPTSRTKVNLIMDNDDGDDGWEVISLNDIKNKETLEKAVDLMLKRLKPNEYEIKETHLYTQILPAKYYEPGSHLLNRQVAFALKHTDERLFLSWVLLRSKASDFDYGTITSLYNDWCKYFNTGKKGVTRKSIMYWAKQDAFEEYEKVLENTLDFYIEETVETQTEFDIAQVLYHKYKDKYVCVSYDKKGVWYVFKNHRWAPDKGLSLRLAISKDIHNLYSIRRTILENEYLHYDQEDDRADFIKKKMKSLSDIMLKLKRTTDKDHIMREAMELFYDKEFITNMDTNKYLLCFNNGVVDFKEKEFRVGYPQDYITKCTKIDYIPYNHDTNNKETIIQINEFMDKLFPIPELNKYMWNHLASCLIGTNVNQTFNVYHGSGSNGKSILADLMSLTLGDYKGTVPITLVTEKRNAIGGTSSEVIQLKGIRYAVMQEPSKGVKLNEGIMKELTGGDPIQGRALYCESETFEPQFKLVVCTNNLFDIESNDDGTWRRIRKCDFVSKFIDEDEQHTDDTQYVFMKDKTLKEKLPVFAPVFASMLVKIAFETDGNVPDCEYIINASNKYRNGQDHIAAFVKENLLKTGDNKDRIRKQELANHFKFWFTQEQGNKKMPKGEELYMYMDKKFGFHKPTGWHGVKILYPDESNNEFVDDL